MLNSNSQATLYPYHRMPSVAYHRSLTSPSSSSTPPAGDIARPYRRARGAVCKPLSRASIVEAHRFRYVRTNRLIQCSRIPLDLHCTHHCGYRRGRGHFQFSRAGSLNHNIPRHTDHDRGRWRWIYCDQGCCKRRAGSHFGVVAGLSNCSRSIVANVICSNFSCTS